MPVLMSAFSGGSSAYLGRLFTFTSTLLDTGDGTCGNRVQVTLAWTDSPAITDDYTVKVYENYSVGSYPSTKGTLIITEISPKSVQSWGWETNIAYNTGGARWFFLYTAELYDPTNKLIHSRQALFSVKGTEC